MNEAILCRHATIGRYVWVDVMSMITRVLLNLVILVASLLSLSGCATFVVLPQIGIRVDEISRYERIVLSNDELLLFYRMRTLAGLREVASDVPKWSRLNWKGLKLFPLDGRSRIDNIPLVIEDGAAPPALEQHSLVPIVDVPVQVMMKSEDRVAYLRDAAKPHEVSYYVYPFNYHSGAGTLILKSADGQLSYITFNAPRREYNAWWAIPVRILFAPFAIAFDVVTSPLYGLCWALGCKI